jgi:DNA-binding response OmpR family regulator
MKKIVIVEDNKEIQDIYALFFAQARIDNVVIAAQVESAETAETALKKIPEIRPDLLIVDISLPGMDGISLSRLIKKKHPAIKILIASANDRETYYSKSKEAGADDFVEKINVSKIVEKTRRLLVA